MSNYTTTTAAANQRPEQRPVKAPWLRFYDTVPATLSYSDKTMAEAVFEIAEQYPDYTAWDFMGSKTTYKKAEEEIRACARALMAMGVRENDRVTICMPNVPQTVVMFYAVNLVGAIANMIHPLSSEGEIEFYIKESGSVAAITLDQFYGKFEAIRPNVDLPHLIITSVADALNPVMKLGYKLTEGRKYPPVPKDAPVLFWKQFLKNGAQFRGNYIRPRRGGGWRRHPLQRRHHGRNKGHPAFQPQF